MISRRLDFRIESTCPGTAARAGRFRTRQGEVETPVFMPVGTQATVRSQTWESLEAAGARVCLANTYHLLRKPGPEVFKRLGGIRKFMSWPHSVLTDSGGYQVFSLSETCRLSEKGVLFHPPDGAAPVLLTPELSIETQKAIDSDIMMVLDHCAPGTAALPEARAAMELTHRWALRSFEARGDSAQALFGIVQGACHPELRRESALALSEIPLDGFAIGGLAVGESKAEREDITEWTAGFMRPGLPRYLMGVGTPLDLLEAVHRGVDLFDCVIPTSYAQRGTAFTSQGRVQVRRTVYREREDALDPACPCPTCRRFSLAYLHHLIKAEEVYGWQLLGQHNSWFYQGLMKEMRGQIVAGTFAGFYRARRLVLDRSDAG